MNKLLTLDEAVRARGVVAFSTGNHGVAVAAAARMLGCNSTIILPNYAARPKVEACRWWATELIFYDPAVEDREEVGRRIGEANGMTVVQPFDDDAIIAGQGTVGLEIAEQMAEQGARPDAALICCSGGGLASGVTEALRHRFPDVRCHVVEPRGYEKMARSLRSGVPETNPAAPTTIMDAIIGPRAGSLPLSILLRHGAIGLSVSDDEALHAMAMAFQHFKLVVEPGGAAALAALLANKASFAGKTVVVVCSGGNVDLALFGRALAIGQAV